MPRLTAAALSKSTFGRMSYTSVFSCPVDEEIMGALQYSADKRTARVGFQAHKFPYTPSVYYQCTAKLCINSAGGCDHVVSFLVLPLKIKLIRRGNCEKLHPLVFARVKLVIRQVRRSARKISCLIKAKLPLS